MSQPPSSHSSRWSSLARPGAMVFGAALLCWRDRSAQWPLLLLVIGAALLLLGIFWPAGYEPVDRGLKFLQRATVRIFSWLVLLVLFVLIFVPGRWLLRSRLRPF